MRFAKVMGDFPKMGYRQKMQGCLEHTLLSSIYFFKYEFI